MDWFRPPGYPTESEPWPGADYLGVALVVAVFIAALVWMPVDWAIRSVKAFTNGANHG